MSMITIFNILMTTQYFLSFYSYSQCYGTSMKHISSVAYVTLTLLGFDMVYAKNL